MPGLQLNSQIAKPLLRLYAVYVTFAAATRLMEDVFQAANLLPSDGRADPSFAALAFVSITTLAWTLFSTAMLLTLLSKIVFKTSSPLSTLRSVELISLETIRGLAAVLLRLPLLVLPALFEWIRLAPLPYLVLLDGRYQSGEKDALQTARSFFSAHSVRVIGLLLISMAVFLTEFALTTTATDALPLWQAPIQHAGSIFVFAGVHLAVDTFLFEMYRRAFVRR